MYSQRDSVFFSAIGYSRPISSNDTQLKKDIVLVTGIANSKPMVDHVSEKINLRHHFKFRDHHEYTLKEVEEIQAKASALNASILTTEKDFVKLEPMVDKKLWFYLPIESRIIDNGSEFDRIVLEKIKNHLTK